MATCGYMKKKTTLLPPSRPQKDLVVEEAAQAIYGDATEVNVRTAKDQLSSLLERASQGEEIVITSDGLPKAMIVRYRPNIAGKRARSMLGLRKAMTKGPDSTAMLRAMRDSGF